MFTDKDNCTEDGKFFCMNKDLKFHTILKETDMHSQKT